MQLAVRDALIGFMAATAQAQAEATKEAQRAGIDHARGREAGYRGWKSSYHAGAVRGRAGGSRPGAGGSEVATATGLSR
jgi:putative DNA-invertase from lambdoid prophage Rac